MIRKASFTAFALLVLATPSAYAQNWYAGVYTSFSDTDDIAFETALGTVTSTFDSDMSFGLFVGYDTSKVRIEGELSTREGDVENHILGGDALPGPTGEATSLSLLANVIYDFNRGGAVQPYIGVGLGYTDVEFEQFGVEPIPDVLNDSDSSFAYQFLVGLAVGLGEDWDLFLDYRWFAADSLDLTVSEAAGAVSSEVDYEVQEVVIGVRYSF